MSDLSTTLGLTACVLHTGRLDPDGYGRGKRGAYAHRVAWEAVHGPVPAGLELHHVCENPACVNVGHLLPLTRLQHRALHLRTHCIHGHPFDAENTYVQPGRSGRQCRPLPASPAGSLQEGSLQEGGGRMTIDPTHDEWQAALRRANAAARRVSIAPTHAIVEAALGCPCPPEPPPEPFVKGRRDKIVVSSPGHLLTPAEAVAMAKALVEHAAYAREQGGEAPVCGHLVADEDVEGDTERCQLPKGHDGDCKATSA